MTREEREKAIVDIRDNIKPVVGGKSLDMAIEALKQKPCEDTISVPIRSLKYRTKNIVAYNVDWLKEHWQMEMDIVCGVKPCEDAISRQYLIEKATNWEKHFHDSERYVSLTDIQSAPPVNPQEPKKGHWIKTISENGITSSVRCSECGFEDNRYMLFRYCPNCGAKMESEE